MRRVVMGAVLVWSFVAAPVRGEPPGPGSVLDAQTAASAGELLPPEVLAAYQAGEYRNEIAAWPARPSCDQAFLDATAKNRTRLGVDAQGTITEAGSPARGIYGLPFAIDATDAQAGVKVIWNAYYSLWRVAGTEDLLALDWLGHRGLERQAVLETRTRYWEGVPPSLAAAENPLGLAAQQSAVVTAPADLNGTATLSWRFRDAGKPDQSWTYVPALRRVRQISPANRSDGFLGSDMSQDDGTFFDGKPEAFEWKLVGAREGYVLVDPASIAGTVERRALPEGGFADEWPAGQRILGHQDPEWKGAPWAPLAPVLVRRPLWIVEAVPHDPYYLFRRIEIALDQETFQGVWSRKFDAQGGLLRSLRFLAYASQPAPGGAILPATSMGYVLAVNVKANRATVAGTQPPGASRHHRRVSLSADLFSLDRLGAGK